jgi:hypothetical protein
MNTYWNVIVTDEQTVEYVKQRARTEKLGVIEHLTCPASHFC